MSCFFVAMATFLCFSFLGRLVRKMSGGTSAHPHRDQLKDGFPLLNCLEHHHFNLEYLLFVVFEFLLDHEPLFIIAKQVLQNCFGLVICSLRIE